MFYIKAFIKSLYDFNWLKTQKNDIKKAGNYFLFFILFLSFVYACFFTFFLIPKIKIHIDNSFKNFADLDLEIKEHKISVSGIEQPFQNTISDFSKNSEEKLFIFIDTISTSSDYLKYSQIDKNENRIIITSSTIALYGKDGTINVQTAEKMSDFSLNKKIIFDLLEKEKTIFIFSMILMFFVLTISKIISAFFVSFVIFLIFRKSKKIDFKNIFGLALFALTLPTLIIIFLANFGISLPFLHSFLLFLILFLVFEQKSVSKIDDEKKEEIIEDK